MYNLRNVSVNCSADFSQFMTFSSLFTGMFLKITSSGATGFDYNAHQSVSASVPVNPPGGPDLQNRYGSSLMQLYRFLMCSKIRMN